jgi:N-acetylglucosamine kinase-like BadF-type ATPase
MSVYVGLDCGGSSSRVLAVDDTGEILFQGQSGAANLVSTPEGRLRKNLGNAVNGCPVPDFVCGCFAGLVNDSIRARGIIILQDTFPKSFHFRAEPDYTAALFASEQADVCVIAGTGSLICSRENGVIVKSGGRGYILGDEGSGYSFGRDVLMTYLNYPDEISNSALRSIQEVFGSTEETVIITGVYKAPSPATILARLVKALGHDAAEGRPYAVASVQRHTTDLARLFVEHVKLHHSNATALSVSLSGGVWKAAAIFKDTFRDVLNHELPNIAFDIRRLTKPPLYGAVELAKEMNNGN